MLFGCRLREQKKPSKPAKLESRTKQAITKKTVLEPKRNKRALMEIPVWVLLLLALGCHEKARKTRPPEPKPAIRVTLQSPTQIPPSRPLQMSVTATSTNTGTVQIKARLQDDQGNTIPIVIAQENEQTFLKWDQPQEGAYTLRVWAIDSKGFEATTNTQIAVTPGAAMLAHWQFQYGFKDSIAENHLQGPLANCLTEDGKPTLALWPGGFLKAPMPAPSSISLSFWVKTAKTPRHPLTVFTKRGEPGERDYRVTINTNNEVSFICHQTRRLTAGKINPGEWTYIVCRYNCEDGEQTVFINEQKYTKQESPNQLLRSNNPLQLGDPTNQERLWLRDVRVFAYPLPDETVAKINLQ